MQKKRLISVDATFTKVVTVYRRLSDIFITQADPIRPSSNTISPSESGARKQRLRGVYANVHSANVLCTSTKKEAAFFNVLRYLCIRGKPFVDRDAFKRHLYVCYALNLQPSTILDIQRAQTKTKHQ